MFDVDCTPAELFNVTLVDVVHAENGNVSSDVGYSVENPYHSNNQSRHLEPETNSSNFRYGGAEVDSEEALLGRVEYILYTYVIVGISGFGILGNVLNLIVLTSKGLQKTMDRMEKSAHCGLVAMAVSDMCFCLGG